MADLDVRIEALPPMRVAHVRCVSDRPEQEAWEKLSAWAEPRGFLGDVAQHPVFGFDNPSPSPERHEYGYEVWIAVPPGTPSEGDVEIKDFPGGLYAVTTHRGLPNPEIWRRLWDWVQSSDYTWRETHELEKPRNPLAPPDDLVFDPYLPIL